MATKKEISIVVVKPFRDKKDHVTIYAPGQQLSFDKARAADVVKRGLARLLTDEEIAEAKTQAPAEAKTQVERQNYGIAAAGNERPGKR